MSISRVKFEKNADDVRNLIAIHEEMSGVGSGRRAERLQVLHRSGIVLVCAIWEAYCEDLAAEALDHLVDHVAGPDALPKKLKQQVAKEIEGELNQLAMWQLAGSGWKSFVRDRLEKLQEQRNTGLNTPKSRQIGDLFEEALGFADVSEGWKWPGISAEQARQKLDDFVTLRGDIAHRGAAEGVKKKTVTDFLGHAGRLVGKTDEKVNEFIFDECGTAIF